MLRAWALVTGAERARRDFDAALVKYGSRAALARAFTMAPTSLREFYDFLCALTPRVTLPLAIAPMRTAFIELTSDEQATFVSVASQLLLEPDVLRQLRHPKLRGQLASALRRAVRIEDLRAAADELRALLDGGEAHESAYQLWCEAHAWAFEMRSSFAIPPTARPEEHRRRPPQ